MPLEAPGVRHRHHLASFNVVSLGAPMLLSNVVCTIEELLPGRFRQSRLLCRRCRRAHHAAVAAWCHAAVTLPPAAARAHSLRGGGALPLPPGTACTSLSPVAFKSAPRAQLCALTLKGQGIKIRSYLPKYLRRFHSDYAVCKNNLSWMFLKNIMSKNICQ